MMWPFNRKKKKVDLAIEKLPQAIDVAEIKWIEFNNQTFTSEMSLQDKLTFFSLGLGEGLKQWSSLKDCPDSFILLIAAKGVEKSKTNLRIEIEAALGFALPLPHVRTDEEEHIILMDRIIHRACTKWRVYYENMSFRENTLIQEIIDIFQIPFVIGIREDYVCYKDMPNEFFRTAIILGILESRTLSHNDTDILLELIDR